MKNQKRIDNQYSPVRFNTERTIDAVAQYNLVMSLNSERISKHNMSNLVLYKENNSDFVRSIN